MLKRILSAIVMLLILIPILIAGGKDVYKRQSISSVRGTSNARAKLARNSTPILISPRCV